MAKINKDVVKKVYFNCLVGVEDDGSMRVVQSVSGNDVFFDKTRIENHKDQIVDWLLNLPRKFRQTNGNGESILKAGVDISGDTWTTDPTVVEMLFLLGMAVGKAEYSFHRSVWNLLEERKPHCIVLN